MQIQAPSARVEAARWLLPMFFVSGATGLVYQSIWARQLHRVFGTSTFAIATVLAVFMGGLAIGGFVAGRWSDRVARPLRVYGLLEVGVGLYALAFPTLVEAVEPLYLAFWHQFEPGPVAYGAFQCLTVGALLVIPTAWMGATLPLLARFATLRVGDAGDRVGTLYSVNTAGAVFGTAVAGFLMLPSLGLFTTTLTAAVANLILGLVALGLDRTVDDEVVVEEDVGEAVPASGAAIVYASMALAGFSSLVLEVAWFRLMGLILGPSVYAFSIMLLAFLVGIAVGGKIGGYIGDFLMSTGGHRRVVQGLMVAEVGVAVATFIGMYAHSKLPVWYVLLWELVGADDQPDLVWALSAVLAFVVMAPPALFMGAAFPLAVRAVVSKGSGLGGPVGAMYGWNTVGSVAGAAVAGFVLLPTLWVQGTMLLAISVNLVAAAILAVPGLEGAGRRGIAVASLAALALLGGLIRPAWDRVMMTSGMYHYVSDLKKTNRNAAGILYYVGGEADLLYYREGLSSVVTVSKNQETGNIYLANNGKVDASTGTTYLPTHQDGDASDMPTQVLCAFLPAAQRPDPKTALVIGLASGVTAGAVTRVPSLTRIDVVELEPAIVEATRFFDAVNNKVLDDPRVRIIANDGRNQVLLTAPGTYDFIVSEPSNPWITGVSNLFTQEFFEVGRTRLSKGGVWSQWVQLYGMGTQDLRTLLRTFSEVYPYVSVYYVLDGADIVLLGSDEPLEPELSDLERIFAWPDSAEALRLIEIDDPMQILAMYRFDRAVAQEITVGVPLNTDDNMRIEYDAPGYLHLDTRDPNSLLLLENTKLPSAPFADPTLWAELARTYRARDELATAIEAMARAIDRSDDPIEVAAFQAEVTHWITYERAERALIQAQKEAREAKEADAEGTDRP